MKYFITKILIILFLSTTAYSAGTNSSGSSSSSNGDNNSQMSYYKKAENLINGRKNMKKRVIIKKLRKDIARALKLLVKSNKKKPNQPNTLNYLGFTTRKLGDFAKGEEYYLQGLAINPNHKGINEYLGELYVATNRMDLAKERLKILESCNCEEYQELREIIEGTKKSKY